VSNKPCVVHATAQAIECLHEMSGTFSHSRSACICAPHSHASIAT